MADNLKMKHAEPSWDVKYNALVDVVEKMGGVVDDLQWSSRTDTGIVLDGWEFTDQHWYTYVDFQGEKEAVVPNRLVHLHMSIQATRDNPGPITLPDNIKPWAPIWGIASTKIIWHYYGKITFSSFLDQGGSIHNGDVLLIDAVYTRTK